MSSTEAMYELKKQLRKLSEFRGSGTELVSVYIPAGYPIHETGNRLREEINQASNIKSKTTRNNVIGALERIIAHLKLFKQTPQNGMVVFAGNISENPSKTDIQLFSLEPPQSLSVSVYRCDSKFFLDPLQRMLEATDSYGIVVMDGREATVAMLKGTQTIVIKKLNSMAHSKTRMGGQCLAAGTLVMRDSGEITEIENFRANERIEGIDFGSSRSKGMVASDFFITAAKHSMVIKTEHPMCEIRATPYHRFFVVSEYGVKEKLAKDLHQGDRLLIARTLNCRGGKVKVSPRPKTRIGLGADERARLREARAALGLSQKKVAEAVGLAQMMISHLESGKRTPSDEYLKRIYALYGLQPGPGRETLKLPEYWNEGLARIAGIICGDGTLDGDGKRIIIYEGSKELAGKYCALIEETTGITPVVRMVDKTRQRGSFAKKAYYEIRIYSAEFARWMARAVPEILAEERDIPGAITACENRVLAAFLSGLYDAKGYMHGDRVDIAMRSEKLMRKLQLLLLRFGILSSFAEKRVSGNRRNRQWLVSISERNSLRSFMERMGFSRSDKREKLLLACSRPTRQQYIDQVPIDGREVFRLAKGLGLKTSDFHAASCFFKNKKGLGRNAFARNILPIFEKQGNKTRARELFNYLSRIYSGDYTIATVKTKELNESEEKFYDLTIPVHSNFIANGFVVHNSARRYQRLIEEGIEYYYKRIGEAMDAAFIGKVKGIIIGGPGPAKDNFYKMAPYNYQHKILGVVDTGYTDEYGIREVIAKSQQLIQEQEVVKEHALLERFVKEAVGGGLATYGEKEVRKAIESRQADMVLLSEGLGLRKAEWKCGNCGHEEGKVVEGESDESRQCPSCGGKMNLEEDEPLIEELADLAKGKGIKVEIISMDTAEGDQFLQGFGGIGAFLRYK